MGKRAYVSVTPHGSWEEWVMYDVPMNADDSWVVDNFEEWGNKSLRVSGADEYEIINVVVEDD